MLRSIRLMYLDLVTPIVNWVSCSIFNDHVWLDFSPRESTSDSSNGNGNGNNLPDIPCVNCGLGIREYYKKLYGKSKHKRKSPPSP